MAESRNVDYSNLCDKLDNLAIKILSVMQNIILERQYLDDNLKEGFINMAKSRYLMKERKISILQINKSNLRASKEVISDVDTLDGIKFTSFCISDKKSYQNASMESHSDADLPYMRDTKTLNSKAKTECTSEEDLPSNKKYSSIENPLSWFGVLVPNTLKTCQSRFEQALETSAKIVTLQNQLKALSEEYRKLRKQKYGFDT